MARPISCSNGMRFEDVRSAADWCSSEGIGTGSVDNIRRACDSEDGYAYGMSWWWTGQPERKILVTQRTRAETRYKSVICSNGMIFHTTGRAAEWLRDNGFPKAGQSNIRDSIMTGVARYGYHWKYVEDCP